jgi:hypothetical protein
MIQHSYYTVVKMKSKNKNKKSEIIMRASDRAIVPGLCTGAGKRPALQIRSRTRRFAWI